MTALALAFGHNRDPKGRIEDRAYFTTDPGLSVEELLAGYSRRWSLDFRPSFRLARDAYETLNCPRRPSCKEDRSCPATW